MWGLTANNIWAVGDTGTILHYTTGPNWAADPQSGIVTTSNLKGLWGSSATDIWAVGDTAGSGIILHYDGTWSVALTPATSLFAVWGSGAKDVWAVGDNTILHYDGTSWTTAPQSAAAVTGMYLQGVWGTSATDVWAVGNSRRFLHYDGTKWSRGESGGIYGMRGIYGSAPGSAWAAGDGPLMRLDGLPPVINGGVCKAPVTLYCGDMATPFTQLGSVASTDTNRFASYSCGARAEPGGEVYYKLEVPVTGSVKVTLSPHGGDLDLIALGATGSNGCDSTNCKAASQIVGTGATDSVTLAATQGQVLYFVVDGPSAAYVSYALQTECTKQ